MNARLNVNVALNRPSYQISTRSAPDGVNYARLANDGGYNTYFTACAHTLLATNPWWAVDLGVALYVAGVKFTNRGDCCGMCMWPKDSSVLIQCELAVERVMLNSALDCRVTY